MISSFDKVLVVLNTLENIDIMIDRSLKLISNKEYTLEVIYVQEKDFFDLPDFSKTDEISKIKKKIKNLVPENCAIFVYINDTVDRILELTKDQDNLLIIVTYHEDITRRLVDKISKSFFILKNYKVSFKDIIIPIDLNAQSVDCIKFIKNMFKDSDIKLLHDNSKVISKQLQKEEYNKYEVLKKDVSLDGYSIDEHFISEVEFIEEVYNVKKHIAEFINSKDFDLSVLCLKDSELILLDSIKTDILVLKNISSS